MIPCPLHHLPQKLPSNTRLPRAHPLQQLPVPSQPRRQHPGTDAPHEHPVVAQCAPPFEHEHVEPRLGGAVGHWLRGFGPPGAWRGVGWDGGVRGVEVCEGGEAGGQEDEAGRGFRCGGGFEEEGAKA